LLHSPGRSQDTPVVCAREWRLCSES
jgi:hypothetical protein